MILHIHILPQEAERNNKGILLSKTQIFKITELRQTVKNEE